METPLAAPEATSESDRGIRFLRGALKGAVFGGLLVVGFEVADALQIMENTLLAGNTEAQLSAVFATSIAAGIIDSERGFVFWMPRTHTPG